MADLHAIITEAGVKGISLTKLKEKSKLANAPLQDELKRLRSALLIAGPFKFGTGSLFFSKGYEPSDETVSRLIEALIRNSGSKLATLSQVEERIKQPFKKFFEDGKRLLIARGRAVELKGGRRTIYIFHADAARQLFGGFPNAGEAAAHDDLSPLRGQIMEAYNAIKAEQGGLSAVSIGKLLHRVGSSKETLHKFLVEEAREQRADLHSTTLTDLSAEDRDGALPLPGKSEPAIMVTFRE